MANDDIIVTEQQEISIKNKSPDKLPLNPTAQGFSGQEIRKRLAGFVIDNDASILQLVKDKLALIKDKLDVLDVKTEGTFEELDVGSLTIGDAEVTWNEADGTLNVQLNNDVSLQLGQEQLFYAKAHQENISLGDPVMFAGVEGNHFRIKRANIATLNSSPEMFIGVASQNIASGEFGYVTEFGFVKDFDTTPYVPEGYNEEIDGPLILWVDTQATNNSKYTTVKPARGYAWIRVAVIVKQTQNQNQLGIIFVRPTIFETQGSASGVSVFTGSDEPSESLIGDLWLEGD
jgi:hypothetical protein